MFDKVQPIAGTFIVPIQMNLRHVFNYQTNPYKGVYIYMIIQLYDNLL